jgi:hypothetical protein
MNIILVLINHKTFEVSVKWGKGYLLYWKKVQVLFGKFYHPPIKIVFVFVIYFQMEQLDEASKPDIPYPYQMSTRGNGTRVNRYLPKPSVSNI